MQTAAAATSTGLAPRTAATLAYAAWWITGLMFWFLEREDRFVRFHAAQAMVGFGVVSGVVVGFAVLAGGSLSFLPEAFMPLLTAAFVTWLGGLVLWLVAMWKAASGDTFRIPLAADLADRLIAR